MSAAVVAVAYQIPEKRVMDFVTWNTDLFQREGVKVVLVTSPQQPYHGLPDWVVQSPYTPDLPLVDGKRTFSLSRCKNWGIRDAKALIGPDDPLISSDIDIWFPDTEWLHITSWTHYGAAVPVYLMAQSYETCREAHIVDRGATGTIAMRAKTWLNVIRYDRRYAGYGAEDGKILGDLKRSNIAISRTGRVFHMAHTPGSNQANFRGRTDFHNRVLNPDRLALNAALYSSTPTPIDDFQADAEQPLPAPWPQFLVFEVGRGCNRAGEHTRCPSGTIDRYGSLDTSRLLSDDQILSCVEYAYDHGFLGHVAWHYYNEPLLSWDRIRNLICTITSRCDASFTLWTNGDRIIVPGIEDPRRIIPASDLSVFATCWLSNYAGLDWSFLSEHIGDVRVLPGDLDQRRYGGLNRRGCLRPFNEFILDYYGNCHLCCADWHGTTQLGNIHDDPFPVLLERHLGMRAIVAQHPLVREAPSICHVCQIHTRELGDLVPLVRLQQQAYLDALCSVKI